MYKQALQGREKALGPDHTLTLKTINNLGTLYKDQDQFKEAEAMIYIPALNTLQNLGSMFETLGDYDKAISYYQRAQDGFLFVLGSQNQRCTYISSRICPLQFSTQKMDISYSVEKTAGRGLKARWSRLKGQSKATWSQ
ncbi:kinesin light chain 1 [Colletotrichum incanum]|uniref:Kinesin light chain 1 n=1 Tax=Colletotrichum incanum TaxID=1573173 RepID=A0A166QY92_COLIC|nr:kinesin light chain 1 [Colletotrichum incanum]